MVSAGPATEGDNSTNSGSGRSRLPGPERRAQLLAVARRVLSDNGYHSTTMTDIAEAAGVTKPVLYQHFASKRDLYRTVLTDIGDRLEEAIVRSAAAAPTPKGRTVDGIGAFAHFVREDFDSFLLLFDGANRLDEEWSTLIRDVERSLTNAIAALIDIPSVDATRRRILAHGIMGLIQSMMRQARSETRAGSPPENPAQTEAQSDSAEPGYPEDQLVRDITGLAWAGLRGIEP